MRPAALALAPLCLALSLAPCVAGAAAPAAAREAPAPSTVDARFEAIYSREWDWRQRQSGGADEDSEGAAANRRMPSVDAASQQARLAVWEDVLAQLDALDVQALSEANRLNLAVYRPQVENLAAEVRLRGYEMPFNSDSSFWSNLGFMARTRFEDVDEAEAYIARLDDVPRYFDAQIANMRAGLDRGFSVPRAVLDGRDASIAATAELDDPEQANVYAPFRDLPARIPAAEQARLREAARAAIRDRVVPAFRSLLAFFRDEYVPRARTTLGASRMPGGEAWYRQQIRRYTTLDLSPGEIHAIGLAEVARIQAQMDAVIARSGFEPPAGQAVFPAFLHFLRTDPRFYATTPQGLLDRAAWIAKRVDGEVGKFIGTLPRGRFTIVPVPDDIAPFWTAGRGGKGTYWVNTYDLPSRPLYNLPALTLHEASPGHALQGALAGEQTGQPAFRRESYISAYGEGWALYTEKLGQEMGIYQTPYEEFGRLTYEMWRACRLVIDTGVHAQGWTREQAQAYLRDRTALSEHEVTTEVDRYISWPGQALSYKLGEIAIVKLRAEAERELGADFDVKAFHDAILRQGSLPLPVLEAEVRRWIAETRAAASDDGRAAG
ncbi:DUF885 domain-containing protein [Marilutibacter spongiae]|uniref:DUF885 family protein n=1 Tax=Marilutibacter spongiae TaxID=2025720 RepID=A0A7W3Y599_9GAMM|nr:DUF885 family protein [Lysobacter spongiae]MBB1059987.1 DUF885 family protein [Lysobacter spongiae]